MMKIARNPYLNRSMIRDPQIFHGRQREASRLAARIASDPPQSVAIIGDRRIGKSSLLNFASHPQVVSTYLEDPQHALFLFLDFQGERRPSIEGFISALFRRLKEALGALFEMPAASSYENLQGVVERLDGEGYRLVLLLDEFDRVTRSSNFDADFFAFLRSLAGSYNVAYITATNRDLQQLCHTQEISDSPFFNIFTSLYLGPFTRDEALGLVREPSAQTPFPLEAHTDLLLELGGHFPFFLQMACSAAFELLVEEGECRREQVCERFWEEARPHFQFYWEQMDPVERAICNDLACARKVDEGRSQYSGLLRRGFVLDGGRVFSTQFAEYAREQYAREVGEEPVEVQAEKLRSMEEELEKARTMQTSLLPQASPEARGLEVAGRCEPANQVGGDFYSYLWLDQEKKRLAIVGVDVMGHGMEGAVTALRFSETLRYEARERTRPEEIMGGLNRSLCGVLPGRAYVGCGIAVLDLERRWVDLAVGGYHPPLHYSNLLGKITSPELGGLPLGIRPDTRYQTEGFALQEGDVLLFFSDGVVEAMDDRETLYGEERLSELLRQGVEEGLDATALLDRLFWDVGRFTASSGQEDDITAIAVRVTE